MTTSYCISVQIGPGSKLMDHYYMTDDIESFSLPWADLPSFCQRPHHHHHHHYSSAPPPTITQLCSHKSYQELWVRMDWTRSSRIHYQRRFDFPGLRCIIVLQHQIQSSLRRTNYDSKNLHWRNSTIYYVVVKLR